MTVPPIPEALAPLYAAGREQLAQQRRQAAAAASKRQDAQRERALDIVHLLKCWDNLRLPAELIDHAVLLPPGPGSVKHIQVTVPGCALVELRVESPCPLGGDPPPAWRAVGQWCVAPANDVEQWQPCPTLEAALALSRERFEKAKRAAFMERIDGADCHGCTAGVLLGALSGVVVDVIEGEDVEAPSLSAGVLLTALRAFIREEATRLEMERLGVDMEG